MKFVNRYKKYWHFFILALFCITPVYWFIGKNPNILINGLDTNFPLDPLVWFIRRLFVWNNIINAGVDFSSSTAGIFFHSVQLTPFLLGFSLRMVEIISMVFWFSAVVISSYILSRIVLPRSKIAQIIFVGLYSFNVYLFNTWENVKVANLSLVASLPLFIASIYLWVNNTISAKRALLFLAFASILATGSGINPAYFSIIALVMIIEGILIKRIKIFAVSILVLLLVNLFWILPLSSFLLTNQTQSLENLGLTNWLNSLSENTSITNVVRLQGAWDWYALDKYGMPQYLPYTLNYLYKFPFILFSFAVPVLALVSFLFVNVKRKFWYLFFGILALLGIFLGVGSHSPTGVFFVFLYDHIPFLSFFRSPWYIFTPLLILSYAGLTGLLFEELLSRFKGRVFGYVISTLGFLFLALYGLYNYPLVNGKIFRPDKDGFYVNFPQYVWDAKKWLSEGDASDRRIISYPDDDLESFNWGYKGTESILGLFADREVIAPSFNIPSKDFGFLLKDFYSHIKREEYASAISVLNFFGADTIFYKKDSPTLSPPITKGIEKFVDITAFDSWLFMKVKTETNNKIYASKVIYNNESYPDEVVFQVPLLASGATVVNGTIDTEITKIPDRSNHLSLLRAYEQGDENDELSNVQRYGFSLPNDGIFDLAIEKLYVDGQDVSIKVDSIDIAKSLVRDEEAFIKAGPFKLNSGSHTVQVTFPISENLLDVSNFSRSVEGIDLRQEDFPDDLGKTLAVINITDKEKVLELQTKNFNPFVRYAFGFDYKYIYGSVPILDLTQSVPTAPVKTHPVYPGSSQDWEYKYDIFRPVETNSKLELLIRMPPKEFGGRSKAYFENMFIRRIYDNKVFVVERGESSDSLGNINFSKISPVEYEITMTEDKVSDKGTVLVFLEGYSKDWVLKPKDGNRRVDILHFTANGYANGWYIPQDASGDYVIYYQPQRLYQIGLGLSIATILSIVIFNLIRRKQ